MYVIPNQESAQLSRKACVKLGHITRTNQEIEEVISTPADSKAEFPSLFSGLGRLKTEYYITFCPDSAALHLQSTPKGNSSPIVSKSQTRDWVDAIRTTWCPGMVPVPKPNGKVQICVDLAQLNAAVQREIHPMPSVDDSLAKLGKSCNIHQTPRQQWVLANLPWWRV